ncbi:hypothetical protein N7516_008151, partial [Penicillium verrucosum]|uniref:uncharacterized protein n=1 Tax=Penicillium verrucosum TaxID=60171 RepID=UPI002545381C
DLGAIRVTEEDLIALESAISRKYSIYTFNVVRTTTFLAKDLINNELYRYDFILVTIEAYNSKGIILAYNKPFLKVIIYYSLLDCLSIELYISTLYISFSSRGKETSESASVILLDTLLLRVRRARFHDKLPVLLNLARELASKITEECSKADLDGL